MNESRSPIFYDKKQRRWPIVRAILFLLSTCVSLIIVILIVGIITNPLLPSLGLNSISSLPNKSDIRSSQPKPWPITAKEKQYLTAKNDLLGNNAAISKAKKLNQHPPMMAFFVNWDETSMLSLRKNIHKIDSLTPEWLHLKDSTGEIDIDDPVIQQNVLDFIYKTRPELPVTPMINNYRDGGWDVDTLQKVISDKKSRTNLIENITSYVKHHQFSGVNIDFEGLDKKHMPELELFLEELHAKFEPLKMEVSVDVPMNDEVYDYKSLANKSDYIVLMAYDEYNSETVGPIASQSWYAASLKARAQEIPQDKYVISLGNYGYDWPANQKGEMLTFQKSVARARDYGTPIVFDANALNPHYEYYVKNDLHHVWYLDAVTLFNQLVEAERYQPRGFALWRLGSEDPSIWKIFNRSYAVNEKTASLISNFDYGYSLENRGQGEIQRVTAAPKPGQRQIDYDRNTGLIKNQKINEYPSGLVVENYGHKAKKIALTFDDGPNPAYTPQILNILKAYNAPATFFIVGANGAAESSILKRELADGHEIGNHTYTHPDINTISPNNIRLELNATDRLLESRIGRRTLLFRSPYAEDIKPYDPDQVQPLNLISRVGYYTVGMNIDPADWDGPDADEIVDRVLQGANEGNGNIVLLHDSGGDRSQTVEALPRIITTLRANGYEIVSISELLGVSRDDIMPPVNKHDQLILVVFTLVFTGLVIGKLALYYLFFITIIFGLLKLVIVTILAIKHKKAAAKYQKPSPEYYVSVIIPAYNEAKVINKTIKYLLASDYPNFDIIVVDDGSKDCTYETAMEQYKDNPQVKIFRKPNGGKSTAINYGITQTGASIIIIQDADTIFYPDTISKLLRHFNHPNIGAVSGNVKVGNRLNMITKWQALEYITSQNLDRRAFDILNCISVVPGAVGAWRKKAIMDAGGFSDATLAEDADLTLTILRLGYKIKYEDEAIALTEAPDNFKAFMKQRYRWMYGTLQVCWKNRDMMFKKQYGYLGLFVLPNIFIFQIIFPFISPVIDLVLVISLATAYWQKNQYSSLHLADNLERIIFYFALFFAIDYLAASVAFFFEKREKKFLLFSLFTQRLVYRQIMYYIAIKSITTAIKGKIVGWGKLDRKATVNVKN